MKILKYLFISIIPFLGILILLAFRPIPTPATEAECLVQIGTVTKIYEGGVNDAVFVLNESKQGFYINRGLENGLNLEELQNKLLHKEITIKYPDYWTPLDNGKTLKHISQLEFGGEVVYSELK